MLIIGQQHYQAMKNDVADVQGQASSFSSRTDPLDDKLANLDARIEKNKAELERNNAELTVKIAELMKRIDSKK